jgi:hypothetical protein
MMLYVMDMLSTYFPITRKYSVVTLEANIQGCDELPIQITVSSQQQTKRG